MKSSLGLCFPPKIALSAVFDTRKEARVSVCVLLQGKRGKVGGIFQLARLVALVVWASSSKTRAGIAKKSLLLSKAAQVQETRNFVLAEKKVV